MADVYQTLQAYLGGLYLNQFNRFGRQWRVFLQAEGSERREEDINQYYVRNNDGNMVPLSSLGHHAPHQRPRIHQPLQPLPRGAVMGAAAPGYSSGQAMAALEEGGEGDAPAGDRLRLGRPLYQEKEGFGDAFTSFALSLVSSCS